ncbi:hypothetical protein [Stratiformator vulcanicus]|uniref:Uncharacterized protein n=1 Tax=Stratiformator vulcanicus TaxID=2527980 RepID=A0A517QYZ7_9PLAN|nr:hypothetical protein [Stratiformator vulcanicus]QDT36861.1 hypothetical protein Pan189_12250 [Stratiformator vulcanicus]
MLRTAYRRRRWQPYVDMKIEHDLEVREYADLCLKRSRSYNTFAGFLIGTGITAFMATIWAIAVFGYGQPMRPDLPFGLAGLFVMGLLLGFTLHIFNRSRINEAFNNRSKLRELVQSGGRFALYLRDSNGESSRIVSPIATRGIVVHQSPTGNRLQHLLHGRIEMFGLWDTSDTRWSIPFQPVLSTGNNWFSDVEEMIRQSEIVILDLETPSAGIVREVEHLKGSDKMNKLIILYAESDQEWWEENYRGVFESCKWRIDVGLRGEDDKDHLVGSLGFVFPPELDSLLSEAT